MSSSAVAGGAERSVSEPGVSKVRVGVLLDEPEMPAWALEALRRVVGSGVAELVLVVTNGTPRTRRSLLGKLWHHRHLLLYLGYSALDRRLFRAAPDAFALRDAAPLFAGVPCLEVVPVSGRFTDTFPPDAIAALRAARLDVIVRFGFRILKGDVLGVARCGVWSYHHGDERRYRGGPPGFWEVMDGTPVTGAVLQTLTEELDDGLVLESSFAGTDPTSVCRNTNAYFWKAAELLPRQLAALAEQGPEAFLRRVRERNAAPKGYSHPLYKPPTNRQFLGPLLRHCARAVGRRASNALFRDRWELCVRRGKGVQTSPRQFRPIPGPRDRFWADPHLVYEEGRYFLFFEDFPFRTRKGVLSVLELDHAGNLLGPPRVVLERPYHLSYPHVFRVGADYYMTPETLGKRSVELYKCVEFPNRWELHHTLMRDVEAVDPTPFYSDGRWWLFVGLARVPGASPWDELHLFSAPELTAARWESHPQNPIVADVRRARPAGPLFRHNGELYRPAQDCSKRYGYGTRLNRIVALTQERYEEQEVTFLEPLWERGLRGTHSITHAGELTVIDVERRRWRWF